MLSGPGGKVIKLVIGAKAVGRAADEFNGAMFDEMQRRVWEWNKEKNKVRTRDPKNAEEIKIREKIYNRYLKAVKGLKKEILSLKDLLEAFHKDFLSSLKNEKKVDEHIKVFFKAYQKKHELFRNRWSEIKNGLMPNATDENSRKQFKAAIEMMNLQLSKLQEIRKCLNEDFNIDQKDIRKLTKGSFLAVFGKSSILEQEQKFLEYAEELERIYQEYRVSGRKYLVSAESEKIIYNMIVNDYRKIESIIRSVKEGLVSSASKRALSDEEAVLRKKKLLLLNMKVMVARLRRSIKSQKESLEEILHNLGMANGKKFKLYNAAYSNFQEEEKQFTELEHEWGSL